MKTIDLSNAEAVKNIERLESHFFDNKTKLIKPAKLKKIAVAFANSDGGEICIGIKDEKEEPNPQKRWEGFTNLEEMNQHLQVIFSLNPTVELEYSVLRCRDFPGFALNIDIDKSSHVHKTSGGTVYQRYGAQSLPVSDPQKITELQFAKGATSYEDTVLTNVPSELIIDSLEIKKFLGSYSPTTDALDFCVNQNLVSYKEWAPRVAGVILFTNNPQALMSKKCAARVSRYETRQDDPERDHLKEQFTIEGPLYELIHRTGEQVSTIISRVSILAPNGLKKLEYPKEAIWETIVNAFIDRDYSISDEVQIFIYNDRLEILSPGKLPGYVNVDNILEARYARNQKIVRTLSRYQAPPNKDMGEGLNTTFQKMLEFGLQKPQIQEDGNYVKVTLSHIPLSPAIEIILHFLKSNPTISNYQARELTGIRSENAVKSEFYKLRERGLLERVPGLEGTRSAWRLTVLGKSEVEK